MASTKSITLTIENSNIRVVCEAGHIYGTQKRIEQRGQRVTSISDGEYSSEVKPGADAELVLRHVRRQGNEPRKPRRNRSSSGKASKKANYAEMVIGRVALVNWPNGTVSTVEL